ncbi:MAG: sugar ABC transporter permease [Micrococcales bacterium]|nr:sugar ABC transporter permease [Actinomycetota bacterium]NCA07370.1 sugar ABC transporter permease [Micrococcales bacterium]
MSLPGLILLTLFVIVPFITAIYLSFFNVDFNMVQGPQFWGLEQYRRILVDPITSPIFYKALMNNMTFALIVVPAQTGLAVLLAVMLNAKLKGIAFFRTFFFMPVVFPMSLVAIIWALMFSRDSMGMLNGLLNLFSFGYIQPIDWLGDPNIALLSIALLSIWAGVGFQMVIVLAGLQEIPAELYEAASLDRANFWQRFWNVTVPGLRNTLIFVIIITTIFSLRLFDQVFILTKGGPIDATQTVMYQAVTSAFIEGNVGRASAITVIFVLIIIAITLLQRLVLRQNREVK